MRFVQFCHALTRLREVQCLRCQLRSARGLFKQMQFCQWIQRTVTNLVVDLIEKSIISSSAPRRPIDEDMSGEHSITDASTIQVIRDSCKVRLVQRSHEMSGTRASPSMRQRCAAYKQKLPCSLDEPSYLGRHISSERCCGGYPPNGPSANPHSGRALDL